MVENSELVPGPGNGNAGKNRHLTAMATSQEGITGKTIQSAMFPRSLRYVMMNKPFSAYVNNNRFLTANRAKTANGRIRQKDRTPAAAKPRR